MEDTAVLGLFAVFATLTTGLFLLCVRLEGDR